MVYSDSVVSRIARYTRIEESGCHLWTGHRDDKGYGRLYVDGKNRQAYRVAFEIKIGRRLNRTECVCHHCDVPACLNLNHLFLGSHSDNMRDTAQKGRVTPPRRNKNFSGDVSRHQLGGDTRNVSGSVKGSLHGHNHEEFHARASEQASRVSGEVCRVRGC